jgi:DNA-binding GntR family transcriptional regulator
MASPKPRNVVSLARHKKSTTSHAALYKRVYEELRRGLTDGLFVPGEVISLRSIADQLGTSAMPVREAIRRLTAEGALELRPSRITVIPMISRRRFTEITELRLELEVRATEIAVRKLAPNLLADLEALEHKAKAARQQHVTALLSVNREFHFTIYDAAGSGLRSHMIQLLWLQSAALTHVYFAQGPTKSQGRFHRVIIEAIREGNSKRAATAMRDDILETADHLLSTWKFPEDDGISALSLG